MIIIKWAEYTFSDGYKIVMGGNPKRELKALVEFHGALVAKRFILTHEEVEND